MPLGSSGPHSPKVTQNCQVTPKVPAAGDIPTSSPWELPANRDTEALLADLHAFFMLEDGDSDGCDMFLSNSWGLGVKDRHLAGALFVLPGV